MMIDVIPEASIEKASVSHSSLFDCKYIRIGICHSKNKYTHLGSGIHLHPRPRVDSHLVLCWGTSFIPSTILLATIPGEAKENAPPVLMAVRQFLSLLSRMESNSGRLADPRYGRLSKPLVIIVNKM